MSFQSLSFLLFLALTVGTCLLLRRGSAAAGRLALLAACLLFYGMSGWGGLALLAFSALLTQYTAPFLRPGKRQRKAIFLAMLCWHIGLLTVFKYTGFLTGGRLTVSWVPLGLSFFTFQQIWYLKEVYAGTMEPVSGPDYLLYAFFFPTVTSGPILKPQKFFPQLEQGTFLHPDWEDAAAGLYGIAVGTGKKMLLADPLGVVVNNGWGALSEMSAPAAWLIILGYTLQLYFDFSGYCDIAAGCARLLGIRLPRNFDSPYRALSVGEFWKRWHISLTDFLRECLYFPLGGSRKGALRTYWNILIVFLVSGIWHGAGWTFIVWGALHGLAQITERLWGKGRERLPKALRWGMTFLFVNLAWVFFRAPDFSSAALLLRRALCGGFGLPGRALATGLFGKELAALGLLLPALKGLLPALTVAALYAAALIAALWPRNAAREMEEFRPAVWQAVLLALLAAWSILSFTGVATFIYSNF